MINLLNPDQQKHFKAARRNTIWLRYILIITGSFIAINAVFGITAWYVLGQENSYKQELNENRSKQDDSYKSDKARAQAFRNNLATAKIILGGETTYSDVMLNIASAIPSNCILDTLTLNNQSFGADQTLSFKCKNPTDSLRLKSALEKRPELFQNVSILSTNQQNAGTETTTPYPVSVTISSTLVKPANGGVKVGS